jgi:hypothetical protein
MGAILLFAFARPGWREDWRWLYRLPGMMVFAGLTLVCKAAELTIPMLVFGGLMLLSELVGMVSVLRGNER